MSSEQQIKSLNETTHGYCAQVELQFKVKLVFSKDNSLGIPVKEWECYLSFPSAFLSSLYFQTNIALLMAIIGTNFHDSLLLL